MRMFDIFSVNLSSDATKTEQGGIRPAIIVQNDIGNKYSPTVIVLPLTTEIKKADLPTHCIIHKSIKNGLKNDSMVLAEQIRVIDKSRLLNKIGYLDNKNEQDEVINAYLANITGKKKYDTVWSKVINLIFKLVKENNYGKA